MNFLHDLYNRIFGNAFWCRMAEILMGAFFLGAALYKLRNFFLVADSHLIDHFQYWKNEGWVASWLPFFLDPILRQPTGEKILEALTILLQFIPGFLWVYGKGLRTGGFSLLIIQSMVFLGTLHHRHFNEFVGISVWVAVFFLLQKDRFTLNTRNWWWWKAMTVSLAGFVALYCWNRYLIGDPWPSQMGWMHDHLYYYTVSSSLWWKNAVLFVTQFWWGQVLWAGVWWATVLMIPLMLFGKTARFAGAVLLTFAVFRAITWLNVYESQGVLWILVLLLWTTYAERYRDFRYPAKRKALKERHLLPPFLYSLLR